MDDTLSEAGRDAHGGKILYCAAEIHYGITQVARELHSRLNSHRDNTDFIVVLEGGTYFAERLLPRLWEKNQGEYGRVQHVKISTYGTGQRSSGTLKIEQDLKWSVEGRDTVIIEDLVDTGFTLSKLKKMLLERGARKVLIAALADKPAHRIREEGSLIIRPDVSAVTYDGTCWLYGCGMDIDGDEASRQLPDIRIIPPKM